MLGALSPEDIERVLHSAPIGRIGCHSGGRTYVVPISFAYDGHRVVAHSPLGTKIQMMRENPEVCFEVEELTDLANWRSVVAWGRFQELAGAEAAAAMGLLVGRLRPLVSESVYHAHAVTPPTRERPTVPTIVFAIELLEKSGRFERQVP